MERDDEIEELRSEVELLSRAQRAAIEAHHEQRIAGRKTPPMQQMTRTQRRYFLEPWFTTGWVVSHVVAVIGFLLAIFTPMSVQFLAFGILWTVIGAMFAGCKYWHQVTNSKTEGELQAPRRSSYY